MVAILFTEHLNYFPYKINCITKYFVFTLLAVVYSIESFQYNNNYIKGPSDLDSIESIIELDIE